MVRDGRTLTYDNVACASLKAGDRVVYVGSNGGKHGVVPAHQ